jgi:prepilin-type N-terminal cleavage/methylation domain-containing protein
MKLSLFVGVGGARNPRRRGDGEAGFTLLEMMVAIGILAVLVSVVPRTFVFARSVIDHSRDWLGARLVAESVLNDTLHGPGLQPGARSGTVNGRRWRATLRPMNLPEATAPEGGQTLLDVKLEVDVSTGRTFDVETIRISSPPSQ